MRVFRWLVLLGVGLSAGVLLAQEALPLSEAVYGRAGVYARYPESWVAFEDDSGTLYLTTSPNLYEDSNLPQPGGAFMAVRVRRFEDTPRIPPNEDTLVATARLVPGTAARNAYDVTRESLRYRAGELDAPFLPNNRHYLLFIDESRFAEVTWGAAPGAFAAVEPTLRRMLETLSFPDAAPPDVPRPGFGTVYFPQGFNHPATSLYDSLNGNLEFDLPVGWQIREPSWERMTITNRQNINAPYLFPGEFTARGTFAPIPGDAVKTPLSLLYDALPAEDQRVLLVDTFTWGGVEMARAVLSDGEFIVTRLVLEPPPIAPEGEEPPPPQLTHYLTLRVTHDSNSLDIIERPLLTFIASARMINETFYPFDTLAYNALDVEGLATNAFTSARADLTTFYPAGWYVAEQGGSLVFRTNSTPLDTAAEPLVQFQGGEALVELQVRDNGYWQDFGITSQTRFHEIPYLLTEGTAQEVTVVTFNEQQALSYSDDFGSYTVILPLDERRFVQARVATGFDTYYEVYLPRVLALMARTQPRLLGDAGGGASAAGRRTFTARSQRVQFDVPDNWFTSENTNAAVSSALVGIPKRGDTPLAGDPASPAFQRNAAALLTITYVEPPTYTVVDDEGNTEVIAIPLYNYLLEVIGENDLLPERITVAGYPALRRMQHGTGHILVQRGDGSIVQIYVQNLTGNPTNNDYSFGYEAALYPVLDTLRYPPADATEPTELYVNAGKGFRVQYPYDWDVRQRAFEFTEGEGEEATTITESVVYFSNVLDFDPANIAPGQVRIAVQVEPALIRRDFTPPFTPAFRVNIGEAVGGATAEGAVYGNLVVFTAAVDSPFRRVVVTMETRDISRFYPTLVKMVQSLEITAAPPPEQPGDS